MLKEKDKEIEHEKKKNKELSNQLLMFFKEKDNLNDKIIRRDKEIEKKDKIIEKFEKELNKISERNVNLINKYTELKLVLAYICRIGISIDDVEMEKFIKEANNFIIRVERDAANRRTIYKTIF